MTNIDKINERILHNLSKDGRISNAELAVRVGLSPSACLRRVQELERSGIIKGYRADPLGNVEFRNTSTQNQKDLAMAGRYTIAEVNEVVGLGEIPPDRVGCPGVFVDAVVKGRSLVAQHDHYRDHWVGMGRL